ncbi:hypothetical protein CEXT_407141 [Caerostris extrusa]|uniref:Uncharacterized protein n=1 Tax=Caerostris extrusa TaxID=172846 RepID=A0AAV4QIL0_CAEEX|nr:hypothetical protein CEXT_407141 [Caerostris extrusa]
MLCVRNREIRLVLIWKILYADFSTTQIRKGAIYVNQNSSIVNSAGKKELLSLLPIDMCFDESDPRSAVDETHQECPSSSQRPAHTKVIHHERWNDTANWSSDIRKSLASRETSGRVREWAGKWTEPSANGRCPVTHDVCQEIPVLMIS